jgi:phage baseplate assembly protein W
MAEITSSADWADLTVYPFGLENRVVTGERVLLEALARRLRTPRGGLFYDPSYGFDVRQFVNSRVNDETIYALSAGVEAECEEDPRVLEARAEVRVLEGSQIELALELETTAGPWSGIVRADSGDVLLISGYESDNLTGSVN